ncbi:MAG: hypothetical protein RL095_4012 [Verrucomicrobiota bacterium]|jgi:UDP-N-acetyl-D-galactosamine dehydrogenase
MGITSAPLDRKLAVIGLGYVGLPLAVEFGKHLPVLGFDIRAARVEELRQGLDHTLEVSAEELLHSPFLSFTCDPAELATCNVFIVTVPTPVDAACQPDFTPLRKASETIGKVLKNGDLVIYESTVYPGCTEEVCVPVLERFSGFKFNRDFSCGYSPERINPGDKQHRLPDIKKVTSGSTPEAAEVVDSLYRRIIRAGTHKASSLKVAEAAKVIENTQRDLNIALVNELALIFNRIGIDTLEVLEAAGTKWNFMPFRPGLVGGHCISVDPYYLTYKAQLLGYHPEVILAGRRINDGMGAYVASQVVKLMLKNRLHVQGARILILGLTFKENCPDIRNTRVIDIVAELREFGAEVDLHDPWADAGEVNHEYGLDLSSSPQAGTYDAVILAVGHQAFRELGAAGVRAFGKPGAVVYDVKSILPAEEVDGRL